MAHMAQQRQIIKVTTRPAGHGFEIEARDQLAYHAARLDQHRRSVLLFYLLFGLILGFCIGLASVKAASASALQGSGPESAIGFSIPNSAEVPPGGRSERLLEQIFGANPAWRAVSDRQDLKQDRSNAFLLQVLPHKAPTLTRSQRRGLVTPRRSSAVDTNILMGSLLALFAIVLAVSVIFWSHLARSYAHRVPRLSRKINS